jgi:hypothetical protein
VKEDGTRRRELVDEENLDQESQKALEADDFVIFGRASVEMFDEDTPSQMLTMEALAKALPQLYEDGIISRRHKDIPVGEVTPEHTLEEPADVQVGEHTLSFEAGETLETQVVEQGQSRPGETAGTASEDEFWIVAKLKRNSEIAKETRLRALAGDLDGFSVTIYAKEWQETEQGQKVTDLDWHAVTIGEEHKIKNKESRFGVAEFKARFEDALSAALPGSDAAGESASSLAEQVHQKANTTMSDQFNGQLFTKAGSDLGFDESRLAAAAELMQKSSPSDDGYREKADEIAEAHEVDVDNLVATAEAMSGEETSKASEDIQAILDQVEETINEEARIALEAAMGDGAAAEADTAAEDDDEEEEGNEDAEQAMDGEMKEKLADEFDLTVDELEEKLAGDEDNDSDGGDDGGDVPDGAVTKEELDERLESVVTQDDLADVKSDLEESAKAAINESLPDIVEDVGEKMATGSTSDPAGGSTHDQVDYSEDIAGSFAPGANGGGD